MRVRAEPDPEPQIFKKIVEQESTLFKNSGAGAVANLAGSETLAIRHATFSWGNFDVIICLFRAYFNLIFILSSHTGRMTRICC